MPDLEVRIAELHQLSALLDQHRANLQHALEDNRRLWVEHHGTVELFRATARQRRQASHLCRQQREALKRMD